ncbi:hypothetical protein ACFYZ2_03825 [Streptomyces sviceus]|uniref:hypothetical protein n=1 Tax=Streptomyces sviceus TaxID=285530 RepID=UPI0036C49ACB
MSTHSPDGSLADDDVVVCEVCELPLFEPVFVFVLVLVFVFVLVVPPVPVDEEEVCPVVVVPVVPDVVVVVPVVPPVLLPAATDVESVPPDCAREAVVAVGVGEAAESVWADVRVVVDSESTVRRCEPTFAEGVVVDAWRAVAGVDAGRPSSEVGSSATPMDRLSGEVDAWVRVWDCWFIAETVRPPPTRATAVATTALRWFFFQRTRWRRRAARPSATTGASATSSDGTARSAAGSSGRPASCHLGASSHAAAAVPVVP